MNKEQDILDDANRLYPYAEVSLPDYSKHGDNPPLIKYDSNQGRRDAWILGAIYQLAKQQLSLSETVEEAKNMLNPSEWSKENYKGVMGAVTIRFMKEYGEYCVQWANQQPSQGYCREDMYASYKKGAFSKNIKADGIIGLTKEFNEWLSQYKPIVK